MVQLLIINEPSWCPRITYGGAVLPGMDGVRIISHGSSGP